MSRRRIVLGTAAALALVIALAPMLARTDAARRFVAGRISETLGRPVEIEGLDAGWTSGVAVRGLVVRSGAGEFRGAPLVEARSVRIETALPSLVFSGADSIAIDGLEVRLEEQAGGRTNVDDLLAAIAKPPTAKKREAKPFRLRLTGASIHVRRLVRQRPPRPIDPFREDPVILDADEGLLVIGIDGLDLLLATTPSETTIELKAAIDVAGSPGRADIALRLGPRAPSGHIHLKGIDLALLSPFVKDLAGTIDLHAEGSPDGMDVKLRANGLKAPRVDEAWAELSGRLKKEGDGVAFRDLSLRTASGAFSLDGRGAWPPKGIEIKANASTQALGLAVKGPLLLDLRAEGTDVSGTLATPDLDARFDVALRDGAIEIRALDAKALASSLSVKGDIVLPRSARLSGNADVNLADLQPLLREGTSLKGRLRVPGFHLEGFAVKAQAEVTGLEARGFFADDLRIERGELHVDASLEEEGDVLRVVRAQLDGLAAEGTVSGLKEGPLRADGTVKGTLALNPLHARLAGLKEIRGLRGQVTVDVTAKSGAEGIDARGTASIDGLHVESDRGTWDLARISAEGSYGGGNAQVRAAADGLKLEGTLADGKGNVLLDVAAIEGQPLLVRALDLPPDVTLRGPVKLRADVASSPWDIKGTIESAALTAKSGRRGVEGEPLRLSFAAREEEAGWAVEAPEIVLKRLGVNASVARGLIGRDGSLKGVVHLEGRLEKLATLAPEAKELEPRGHLAVDAEIARHGGWSVAGTVAASDASAVLSDSRPPPRTAKVEFAAALAPDGTVAVERVRLVTKTTDLQGTAKVGASLSLRLKGRARLEEIAPYVPMLNGSGEVTIEDLAVDLTDAGALTASASLRTESVRVEGSRLLKASFRSRVDGRMEGGAFEDVKTDLALAVGRVERGNILVEDLVLREKGGGRSGAYSLGTRIEIGRVAIDDIAGERLAADCRGRLDKILAERPMDGLEGDITFARFRMGGFQWQDAKGKVLLENGSVVLKDLVGGLNDGSCRVNGKLTPAGDRMAWEGSVDAKGVVLTEQISRPISFVIPFLRVAKGAGKLTGRADFDMRLAADDTTEAAILRTLAGAGVLRLYDIEAKNSILLPLLAFRFDKAVKGEPCRFKDLRVPFDIGNGAVRPTPFEIDATPIKIKVKEIEVGLDGSVESLIIAGIIPLRVRGTLDDPKVRPAPLAPFR